jgi:hypothetical protein
VAVPRTGGSSLIAHLQVDPATGALELHSSSAEAGVSPLDVLQGFYGPESVIQLTNCRAVEQGAVVWRDLWLS